MNVCTANTCTVDDELVSDLSSSHSYKTQKADFKTTNILFFFQFSFSKSFLRLRLYLLTVQNVLSNKTIYSGEVECDLAHSDV